MRTTIKPILITWSKGHTIPYWLHPHRIPLSLKCVSEDIFDHLFNNIIFPTFKWSRKRSSSSCSWLAEWEQLWVSRSAGRILYQLPLLFLVVPARLYSNKNARARLESDLTEKWSPCSCFSCHSSCSFLSLQLQRVINK